MITIEKKRPVSTDEMNIFLSNISFELPEGFVEFFSKSNGALITGENVYIDLWQITEMIESNKNYKTDEFFPEFFIFGSDLGGTAFLIEKATANIYENGFIAMPDDAKLICKSFTEFLKILYDKG